MLMVSIDENRIEFIVVVAPEGVNTAETKCFITRLRKLGIPVQRALINGVITNARCNWEDAGLNLNVKRSRYELSNLERIEQRVI
jgi:hypothetical protein